MPVAPRRQRARLVPLHRPNPPALRLDGQAALLRVRNQHLRQPAPVECLSVDGDDNVALAQLLLARGVRARNQLDDHVPLVDVDPQPRARAPDKHLSPHNRHAGPALHVGGRELAARLCGRGAWGVRPLDGQEVARLLRVDDREDRAAGERDAVDRHDLVADAEQAGGSRARGNVPHAVVIVEVDAEAASCAAGDGDVLGLRADARREHPRWARAARSRRFVGVRC
mmetsp:Transcript_37072/g.110515  ORF Transcript_37072/g.110515 Transcript_37072/m.110515 type:complete len:226 (+) Transcript_37072:2297-2974(+)